jgi:hypothetical protein
LRTLLVALTLGVAAACTAPLPEPVPVADPGELAAKLQAAATPEQSRLIAFKWRYRGREGRFTGEGAVRVNPPDSVRLDLFGPDWAAVESAVLLGDEVYYTGDQRFTLPAPAFMWTLLGVFRPPATVTPRAVRRGELVQLVYDLAGDSVVGFRFDGGGRLVAAEMRAGGAVVQDIRLKPGGPEQGASAWVWPEEARYRDLGEFHEVLFTVTEARAHAPFDPSIFRATAR